MLKKCDYMYLILGVLIQQLHNSLYGSTQTDEFNLRTHWTRASALSAHLDEHRILISVHNHKQNNHRTVLVVWLVIGTCDRLLHLLFESITRQMPQRLRTITAVPVQRQAVQLHQLQAESTHECSRTKAHI